MGHESGEPTNCDKIHDEFTCAKCGFSGRGLIPEVCPACKATKFELKCLLRYLSLMVIPKSV